MSVVRTQWVVMVGIPGEHVGPVLGGYQDGEAVCQCLTCGKCWSQSNHILMEADEPEACEAQRHPPKVTEEGHATDSKGQEDQERDGEGLREGEGGGGILR